MTTKIKELLYFIATIGLIIIGSIWIFGLENLIEGELVLNVHDTYFVIDALHFLIVFTPLLFALSYLIKNIISKFKNIISNTIFLIFNGFLILVLSLFLIGNEQDHFKLNDRFWILILIFLILEFFVLFKSLKLRKAIK